MTGTELAYKTGMKARKTTGGSAGTELAYNTSMERKLGTFERRFLFEEVMAGATESTLRAYDIETKPTTDMITTGKNSETSQWLAEMKLPKSFVDVKEALTNVLSDFEKTFVLRPLLSSNTFSGVLLAKGYFDAEVIVADEKVYVCVPERLYGKKTHVILFRVNEETESLDMCVFRKADFDAFVAEAGKTFAFSDAKAKGVPAGLCAHYSHRKDALVKTYLYKDEEFPSLSYVNTCVIDNIKERRRRAENKSLFRIMKDKVEIDAQTLEMFVGNLVCDGVYLEAYATNRERLQGTDFVAHTTRGDELRLKVKIAKDGLFEFPLQAKVKKRACLSDYRKMKRNERVKHYFISDLDTTHYLLVDITAENEAYVYLVKAEEILRLVENVKADKEFRRINDIAKVWCAGYYISEKLDRLGIEYKGLRVLFTRKGVKMEKLQASI